MHVEPSDSACQTGHVGNHPSRSELYSRNAGGGGGGRGGEGGGGAAPPRPPSPPPPPPLPPLLLFKHLPKAGGTASKELLSAALGGVHYSPGKLLTLARNRTARAPGGGLGLAAGIGFALLPEFSPVKPEHKRDFFTVGLIRHPCSYLLSLWAYGSGGAGTLRKQITRKDGEDEALRLYGHDPPFNSPADLDRLTAFLQLHGATMWQRLKDGYGATGEGGRPSRGSVHCWATTSSLEADLRACLRRFEKERGGQVDWGGFERTAAIKPKGLKQGKKHVNQSKHVGCQGYFGGGREAIVRDKARDAFMAFGFQECCEPEGR